MTAARATPTGQRGPKARQGALLATMPEREFQRHVVAALRRRGWTVWVVPNMRLTTAGLPDVVAWHPNQPGRLLAWELKSQTGRVKPSQRAALAHLATIPGVDARIVRPADWDDAMAEAEAVPAAVREGTR